MINGFTFMDQDLRVNIYGDPLISRVNFLGGSSLILPYPMTREQAKRWAQKKRGKEPVSYQLDLFARNAIALPGDNSHDHDTEIKTDYLDIDTDTDIDTDGTDVKKS